MSIYAYTGLPGSGKSYDVVANQILPALKAGRKVVTNVPLHMDAIKAIVPNPDVVDFPTEQVAGSPELIEQYAVRGCLLVLDEVAMLWPSGVNAKNVPEPFRKLLTQHRHMVDENGKSMQIVLVTQDLAQIGAFARQLVENTFHHTKLTNYGSSGSYRIDVYEGPVSGPRPKGTKLRQIFGRYDAATFKLYKSHTMSDATASGGDESAVDGRANVWKRTGMWVLFAMGIAMISFGAYHFRNGLMGTDNEAPTKKQAASRPAAAVKTASGAFMPAVAAQPPAPGGWRLAGYYRRVSDNKGKAVLTDGRRNVVVEFDTWCTDDLSLGPSCQWEGQTVWPWSTPKYAPVVSKPAQHAAPVVQDDGPVDYSQISLANRGAPIR